MVKSGNRVIYIICNKFIFLGTGLRHTTGTILIIIFFFTYLMFKNSDVIIQTYLVASLNKLLWPNKKQDDYTIRMFVKYRAKRRY
jgi:hypothetical protein